MANVCPSCGAENREKARFCRGCARPLDRVGEEPASDSVEDLARARRRARRRESVAAAGAAKRRQSAWSRLTVGVAAVAIALGAGWWLFSRQASPLPAQAAPMPLATLPVSTAQSAATPAVSSASTNTEATPAPPSYGAALAVDRLRQSVEVLQAQDRERTAALEQQRTKLVQDKLRAEEARRKTDALAASTAVAGPGSTSSAVPTPVAPPPVAQANAPTAVTTGTAVAAPTVDQVCAGSSNFVARDFCRIRECGKAAFATDPVCVRFRQMEEARRQDN
jgi:hypothetical protein